MFSGLISVPSSAPSLSTVFLAEFRKAIKALDSETASKVLAQHKPQWQEFKNQKLFDKLLEQILANPDSIETALDQVVLIGGILDDSLHTQYTRALHAGAVFALVNVLETGTTQTGPSVKKIQMSKENEARCLLLSSIGEARLKEFDAFRPKGAETNYLVFSDKFRDYYQRRGNDLLASCFSHLETKLMFYKPTSAGDCKDGSDNKAATKLEDTRQKA